MAATTEIRCIGVYHLNRVTAWQGLMGKAESRENSERRREGSGSEALTSPILVEKGPLRQWRTFPEPKPTVMLLSRLGRVSSLLLQGGGKSFITHTNVRIQKKGYFGSLPSESAA